ncbi:cadherin-like domain-containing protein, partial [bacterium]|nr:cadherin-like domain-containing protein [bacterium]
DNNRLRYVHDGSEPTGTDQTMSYTVAEGATSNARTLTIKISPVNDVPVLYVAGETPPSSSLLVASVQRGGTLTFGTTNIRIVDPDNTDEQLVFSLASMPAHGELTLNGAAVELSTVFSYANLAQLVYTHDGSQIASDQFSVMLRDGAGGVVAARDIILTIAGVVPAVAVDDTLFTDKNTAVLVAPSVLLGNDSIVGGTLSVSGVGPATNGTVSLVGNTITFTPTAGFVGTAGFDYTVLGFNGAVATAHVVVTVSQPSTLDVNT